MTRLYLPALLLIPLAACEPASDNSAQLANPAATFCVESGGEYRIVDGADGQTGRCTLPDGRDLDAWEYFRENHAG